MKVLLVQEKTFLATALRLALLSKGYELIVSSESSSAQQAIVNYNPQIVITDITNGKGYNYVEQAKKLGIPVIVICNDGCEDELYTAFEKGADDYICMPLSFSELALRVSILTRRKSVA